MECAHGHKKRSVGCVSCVLVFDNLPSQGMPEDFEWARERVVKMCASELVNASVYGKKLLKGFGYPDEAMRAAQDGRALQIVLEALSHLTAEHQRLREAVWPGRGATCSTDEAVSLAIAHREDSASVDQFEASKEQAEAETQRLREERDQAVRHLDAWKQQVTTASVVVQLREQLDAEMKWRHEHICCDPYAGNAALATARQQVEEMQRWKDHLTDAAVVDWCLNEKNADDPKQLIADIVKCNVRQALDPAISQAANELIATVRCIACDQHWSLTAWYGNDRHCGACLSEQCVLTPLPAKLAALMPASPDQET
jgi:hypothetical protein